MSNMKLQDFWRLLKEVFGDSYGSTMLHDLVIPQLNNVTAHEALEQGIDPRVVWNALCDQAEIPESERWGKVLSVRK